MTRPCCVMMPRQYVMADLARWTKDTGRRTSPEGPPSPSYFVQGTLSFFGSLQTCPARRVATGPDPCYDGLTCGPARARHRSSAFMSDKSTIHLEEVLARLRAGDASA